MTDEARRRGTRRREVPAARIGGAWKVAYADLATAMMALFLVLWLGTQDFAVRQAVAHYFQDPIGFDAGAGAGRSPLAGTGRGAIDGVLVAPRSERALLDRAAKRLQQTLASLPAFQALGSSVELAVGSDGLRIDLVERDGASFFARGGRTLSPEGAQIVTAIGRELGALGNDLVLEGHTDSVPFRGEDGYSNWELSTDRANSARRALEAGGVSPQQVKGVHGYADSAPRIAAAPDDPRNRRVAILVLPRAAVPGHPTPE